MTATKKQTAMERAPWKLIALACIPVTAFALMAFVSSVPKAEAQLSLSNEVKAVYAEALSLASEGKPADAIARLDAELATVPDVGDAKNLYTRAKLEIYKADIMITYALEFKSGFVLLGEVYGDTNNSAVTRSEALMLAMAHSVQGLDEGLLTVPQVRDYVLLDKNFSNILTISSADAAGLETPQDTYTYLSRGFAAATKMTSSDKISVLSRSYSERLLAPFVISPPDGGYYHSFVASLESTETGLDEAVTDYASQNISYQEFIPTSYFNLARAYEALPQGDVDVVGSMTRLHDKLAAYVASYPDSAYGTNAYLTGISTRLVCKAVDLAGYDASNVNKDALKPYLDEIYQSEGWVVPCKEAFQVVAHDIDPRFAKYF